MKLTKSLVKKGGKKSLKKSLKMQKSKKGGKKSLNTKKARKTRKMKGGDGVEVELIIPPRGEKFTIYDEYEKVPLINQAGEKVTYEGVVMYIGRNQNEGILTSLYFEHPQEEESKKVIRHSDMMKKVDFDKEDEIVAELPDDLKKHILQEKNYQYFVHKDFEKIYKDLLNKGMNAYGMFEHPEEEASGEGEGEKEGETNGGKKKNRKTRKTRKMKLGGMFDSITTAYDCVNLDDTEEVNQNRKNQLEARAQKEIPEGSEEPAPEIKDEQDMVHQFVNNNFGTKDYYRKARVPGTGEPMLCFKHRDQNKAKEYDNRSGY